MESEASGTVKPPEVIRHCSRLEILGDALVYLLVLKGRNRMDLWILKQYGFKGGWNKIFSMGYNSCPGIVLWSMPIPVYMTGEGEILIRCQLSQGAVQVTYDPKNRSFK